MRFTVPRRHWCASEQFLVIMFLSCLLTCSQKEFREGKRETA